MFWIGLTVGLLVTMLMAIPTLTVGVLWGFASNKVEKFSKRLGTDEYEP